MIKTLKENILTRLIKAFGEKNEKEFVFLLEKYSISSDMPLTNSGIDMTIFEYVLKTPNSSNFIDICVDYSTSVLKKNPRDHYLLYYAIQSLCADNVDTLLKHIDIHQNNNSNSMVLNEMLLKCEPKNSNNHLHDVIEKLTDANYSECYKIIKILLSHGCNANHLNSASKSPFELLLEKTHNKSWAVDFAELFSNVYLEINDTEFYKQKISALRLNNVVYRNRDNFNAKYLFELLKQGNEREYIHVLRNANVAEVYTYFNELMKLSIDMNFAKAVTILLELVKQEKFSDNIDNELDMLISNLVNVGENPPLFYAVSRCRYQVIEELLKFECVSFQKGSTSRNVLHDICSLKDIESDDDFQKSFDLILRDKRCTEGIINAYDSDRKTPLIYACENGHIELKKELIRRDAYIGHEFIVENLCEKILGEQLDESITPSTDVTDQNCIVQVNYKFLIPPRYSENRINEMEALQLIASQPKFKTLITHPVLTSFLELKWKRLNFLMYGTLLIYFIFFFYLSVFIMSFFNNACKKEANLFPSRFGVDEDSNNGTLRNFEILKILFGRKKRDVSADVSAKDNCIHISMAEYIKYNKIPFIISLVGTLILTICEFIQFYYTWRRYFFKLSNWADCALLGLAYVVLLQSFGDEDDLRKLRAVLFLVIAIQCFILISRVSKLSLHLEIFKKVSKTFLKFITLYFMLIFAFAMAFYTLYSAPKETGENIFNTDKKTKEEEDDDNSFTNILLSTITVIRMMLSDFEGIKLKPDDQFNAIIFLWFILLITIILFNLLNALAIADTQQMMKSAEIVDVRKRIRMISTCEKVLAILNIDFFNIYFHQIQDGRIFLNINKDNYVRIKKKVDEGNRHVFRYFKVPIIRLDNDEKSDDLELKSIRESNRDRLSENDWKLKIKNLYPQYLKNLRLKLSWSTVAKIIEHLKYLDGEKEQDETE